MMEKNDLSPNAIFSKKNKVEEALKSKHIPPMRNGLEIK
jgi:hypothetical protein